MPNWCDNRLRVVGPTEVVNEFVNGAKKKVGDSLEEMLIMHNYLPFPPALEGRVIETDNGISFGTFTDRGYNWCLANWGCKWGDSGTRVIDNNLSGDGETTSTTIYMNTPWGPPDQGICNISAMFPELTFTLAFHEDGMSFSGVVQYSGGEMITDIDNGSPPEYDHENNDEDAWIDAIEAMYDYLFAAAYSGGKS